MYTIDTSVWIGATEPTEIDHAACRSLLTILRRAALPIVVPTLVRVEISGALSRLRSPTRAARVIILFDRLPHVALVALDVSRSHLATALARTYRLRGADAVYAAVAQEYGTTLVSRDHEHLTRLVGVVSVLHPAAALAALGSPS